MRRVFSVLVLVSVVGIGRAYAQETGPGPGVVDVSIIPGGGIYFTEATDAGEPAFGNYDVGGAFTVNVSGTQAAGGCAATIGSSACSPGTMLPRSSARRRDTATASMGP